MHMFNSFVTLTYDDDHLPEYNSLNYKHFQDFMKRLRKSHNGVRFYSEGALGELNPTLKTVLDILKGISSVRGR